MSLSAFRLRPDGLYEAEIVLDAASRAIVASAVDVLAAPRRAPHGADDAAATAGERSTWTVDPRPAGLRRAEALVEVCTRACADDLTGPMGATTQVLVTASVGELTDLTAVGRTVAGEVLAPSIVRLLTCDTDLTTVATDGTGTVLDVGRTQRLATTRQRKALMVRDGGCTFPGCDRPPAWCRVHHIVPWSRGGGTDMSNQALLCSRHHTFVHHHDVTGRVEAAGSRSARVRWDVIRTRSGWRPTPPPAPTRPVTGT